MQDSIYQSQHKPSYQMLQCREHEGKYITQIDVRPKEEFCQGDAHRLLCVECKMQDSTHQGNDCLLENIFKNPLQVFATTNYLQNVNQEFCSFYLQLKPEINEEYMKKMLRKLISELINEIKNLEKKWLADLKNYSEYIETIKEFAKLFKERLDPSKIKEILEKYDRSKEEEFYTQLNNNIEDFVGDIHKKQKNDEILKEKIQNLREQQKLYYNENMYQIQVQEIKEKIKNLGNVFYKSHLPQSILSNEFFATVLKQIKEDYDPSIDKDKINLIYRMSEQGKKFQNFTQYFNQLTEYPVLIIFQTEQRKVFGVYAEYVSKLGDPKKQDNKSFIFDALKQQIFMSKNTYNPLEINLDENKHSLIKVGDQDIQIYSNFDGTSEVNKAFVYEELKKGNHKSHLAGIEKFKIVNMEVFAVTFEKSQQNQQPQPPVDLRQSLPKLPSQGPQQQQKPPGQPGPPLPGLLGPPGPPQQQKPPGPPPTGPLFPKP